MTDRQLEQLEGGQSAASGRKRKADEAPAAAAAPRRTNNSFSPAVIDVSRYLCPLAEVLDEIEKLDADDLGTMCRQMQINLSGRKDTRLERVADMAQVRCIML